MQRREFAKVLASSVIGAGLAGAGLNTATTASAASASPTPRKNTMHRIGGDYHCMVGEHWTSKENFEYHARQGCYTYHPNMGGGATGPGEGGGGKSGSNPPVDAWNLDEMKRWKDACDKGGMTWEGIRMDSRYIFMRPGAQRDRKIEAIIGNIQKASQVGVKMITHHWTLIPIRRNTRTPGRGGCTYTGFKLEDNWKDLPVYEPSGVVPYDEYWERITYFLTKVIPVCEQYDVRMAVHPYDPPGLPRGYQGVDNWDAAPSTVLDSLKKYEAVVDSHYNGFQLCLGTCAEGLKNPRTEILPIVKYLAEKKKIHNVHMRNIRGGLHNFQEVYHDEGDMHFLDIIRILRDAGYAGTYLPDHAPAHPDDPRKDQAFAMAFGYINSLIQAANNEVT